MSQKSANATSVMKKPLSLSARMSCASVLPSKVQLESHSPSQLYTHSTTDISDAALLKCSFSLQKSRQVVPLEICLALSWQHSSNPDKRPHSSQSLCLLVLN